MSSHHYNGPPKQYAQQIPLRTLICALIIGALMWVGICIGVGLLIRALIRALA